MISAVILTLNSREFIKSCLDSLFAQDPAPAEIIVVDNASRDGTVDFIKKEYPGVILVENKSNLGAAQARNQGIEIAAGEWVLCLDCDVVLESGFSRALNLAIGSLPSDIGIIQPKILTTRGQIYSAGIRVSYLRRFSDIGRGKENSAGFNAPGYLFGACSAAALYKKSMLDNIKEANGYFDKEFFFLFEDVDLSWRAHRHRHRAIFWPKAVCRHRGDSSATGFKIRQYLCLRNRYYTLLKNDSPVKCLIPFLIYDLPRLVWLAVVNPRALKALEEVFIYAGKLKP